MSEMEQLEQAYLQLIQCVNEAENEPDIEATTGSQPSDDEPKPSNTVEVVMQATDKWVESLCILQEFEMMIQDKIASMHIISHELMLSALHLLEHKDELAEVRKKAKEVFEKLYQGSELLAESINNIC